MGLAYCLVFIFSIIDFLATRWLVIKHGTDVELNPILHYFMTVTDSTSIIMVNKIIPLIILAIPVLYYIRTNTEMRPLFAYGIWAVTIGQMLVAVYGSGLVLLETLYA